MDSTISVKCLRNPDGGVDSFVALIQDNTLEKSSAARLRQSEEMLRRAQRVARVGCWTFDMRRGLADWSDEMYRIFGIDPGTPVTNELFFSKIHPDDRQDVEDATRDAFCGKPYDIRHRIVVEGRELWVHGRAEVEFEEKTLTRAVGTLQDITDVHGLEERLLQSQKMEAVGKLAAGVAHDFNNILQAMTWNLQFLQEQVSGNGRALEFVEELSKGCERAANLNRQLLAFSRQQVLRPRVMQLNDSMAGVARMLARLIGEDIELIIMPGAEIPRIHADPSQMEQVLLNLCLNARDAMPQGGKISVWTERRLLDTGFCAANPELAPGLYASLHVSDSGEGMDAATRSRIFEPFFTTKALGKGTGLGLATVYGIVKQHRGHIDVESEPGVGTTFRIYLPATDRELEPRQRSASVQLRGSETILLAEDEPMVRDLASEVLRDAGYDVIAAANGEEAVERFRENRDRIGCLVFDTIMPRLNGYEAFRQISMLRPEIRVVFISGYSTDDIRERLVGSPGLQFLQKPFESPDLLGALRRAIDAL